MAWSNTTAKARQFFPLADGAWATGRQAQGHVITPCLSRVLNSWSMASELC